MTAVAGKWGDEMRKSMTLVKTADADSIYVTTAKTSFSLATCTIDKTSATNPHMKFVSFSLLFVLLYALFWVSDLQPVFPSAYTVFSFSPPLVVDLLSTYPLCLSR